MTRLDSDLQPEPVPVSSSVPAARRRRALDVGSGGARDGDLPRAKSPFAGSTSRSSDIAATCPVDGAPRPPIAPPRPSAESASRLQLDDALVVPAGAVVRGDLRCRAMLLVGEVVGNVHCTGGPVVVRAGASLKGRQLAAGDVYVFGSVGDGSGGTVIATLGKVTLAPGSRVEGDVRSARLDMYDGAMLRGVAKGCER